jgi:hypothetical protein
MNGLIKKRWPMTHHQARPIAGRAARYSAFEPARAVVLMAASWR